MVKYIICAYREWNTDPGVWGEGSGLWKIISSPEGLGKELERLDKEFEGIDWVFFLDWSWHVPKEILNKYRCVCFHESDLPNYRGGSPIQNQIIRGIKDTKLTAFLMEDGIDKGDILLQEDLSLRGHLREIMERVVKLEKVMIERIISGDYVRKKQVGNGSYYARREPFQSQFDDLLFGMAPLEKIYDQIRMLEDPYPNAFLEIGERKIVFKSAEMENGKIKALIEIV